MPIKQLILIASLLGTLLSSASCWSFSSTFTSPLPVGAQKVSLEEAGSIIGVNVPAPTYLPESYKIQEIFVTSEREVTFLISDKEIEKELTTPHDGIGTGQSYDVKSAMRMVIRWYPEGGGPIKLPVEKVQINESWGFLQDRGDHRALWWDWFPEPDKPAMFELVLAASKKVSKDELIKIAESVR